MSLEGGSIPGLHANLPAPTLEAFLMSFANRQASHNGRGALLATEFMVSGGAVRNDLSTALVKLYCEMFGRGPVKTTTHAFDAGYVTFLRDVFAPHERLLILDGRADLVRATRTAVREARREHLIAEVQRLTGRPILHDSFQFQPERDLAIEMFWIPPASESTPPTAR